MAGHRFEVGERVTLEAGFLAQLGGRPFACEYEEDR